MGCTQQAGLISPKISSHLARPKTPCLIALLPVLLLVCEIAGQECLPPAQGQHVESQGLLAGYHTCCVALSPPPAPPAHDTPILHSHPLTPSPPHTLTPSRLPWPPPLLCCPIVPSADVSYGNIGANRPYSLMSRRHRCNMRAAVAENCVMWLCYVGSVGASPTASYVYARWASQPQYSCDCS